MTVLLHTGDDNKGRLFYAIVHSLTMGQWGLKHEGADLLKHYCNYKNCVHLLVYTATTVFFTVYQICNLNKTPHHYDTTYQCSSLLDINSSIFGSGPSSTSTLLMPIISTQAAQTWSGRSHDTPKCPHSLQFLFKLIHIHRWKIAMKLIIHDVPAH